MLEILATIPSSTKEKDYVKLQCKTQKDNTKIWDF